ncbi:hypothetical protein OsI_29672 [Oryza sativa Indica Group]|uniref:Uncharacterized protein n=1 Tax=Oryza sativa subsp. indica TaxID=39946 RepID=A2YWF9_ORYSI|nr:hypothetical protein OsI_29672 [Oryza sativa Indica Group]
MTASTNHHRRRIHTCFHRPSPRATLSPLPAGPGLQFGASESACRAAHGEAVGLQFGASESACRAAHGEAVCHACMRAACGLPCAGALRCLWLPALRPHAKLCAYASSGNGMALSMAARGALNGGR